MFENYTVTGYPPVSRLANRELERQKRVILKNHQLITFVESISQMVVILNENRQIVYANKSYLQFCNTTNVNPLFGMRPGESFNCKNAFRSVSGCGTTRFCKNCGAANAIFNAQQGVKTTNECTILTTGNEAINLEVTATPYKLDNEKLTIFSIIDISHEKRKQSLERVFIHDILNSAGGISGLSAVLKELESKEEIDEVATTIEQAANDLIEEIKTQREIGAAERGDLAPNFQEIDSLSLINDLAKIYSNHDINPGKKIVVLPDSENHLLKTDPVLLKRILGNMTKNALEAKCPNDKITLSCKASDQAICFAVHNKSFIPEEIQGELFKRFYSTKGNGRGIGTYSMKLLGEKYLGGKVWFESTPNRGTTFYFKL